MLTEIDLVSGEEQNPFQQNESKRRRAIKLTRRLILSLWCRMMAFPPLPTALPTSPPGPSTLQLKQSTMLPAVLFHLKFWAVRSGVHSPQGVGLEEVGCGSWSQIFLFVGKIMGSMSNYKWGVSLVTLKYSSALKVTCKNNTSFHMFFSIFEYSGSDLLSPDTLLRLLNSTSCRPSITNRDKERDLSPHTQLIQ